MHPLTHPLPVTAHALLLDNGILTPAQSRFFYIRIRTRLNMTMTQ